MARAGQEGKKMPVANNFEWGSPTGKPESQGKIKYGEDLRTGGKKK